MLSSAENKVTVRNSVHGCFVPPMTYSFLLLLPLPAPSLKKWNDRGFCLLLKPHALNLLLKINYKCQSLETRRHKTRSRSAGQRGSGKRKHWPAVQWDSKDQGLLMHSLLAPKGQFCVSWWERGKAKGIEKILRERERRKRNAISMD